MAIQSKLLHTKVCLLTFQAILACVSTVMGASQTINPALCSTLAQTDVATQTLTTDRETQTEIETIKEITEKTGVTEPQQCDKRYDSNREKNMMENPKDKWEMNGLCDMQTETGCEGNNPNNLSKITKENRNSSNFGDTGVHENAQTSKDKNLAREAVSDLEEDRDLFEETEDAGETAVELGANIIETVDIDNELGAPAKARLKKHQVKEINDDSASELLDDMGQGYLNTSEHVAASMRGMEKNYMLQDDGRDNETRTCVDIADDDKLILDSDKQAAEETDLDTLADLGDKANKTVDGFTADQTKGRVGMKANRNSLQDAHNQNVHRNKRLYNETTSDIGEGQLEKLSETNPSEAMLVSGTAEETTRYFSFSGYRNLSSKKQWELNQSGLSHLEDKQKGDGFLSVPSSLKHAAGMVKVKHWLTSDEKVL